MLKLERRSLDIQLPEGEIVKMRFPTLAQIEEIQLSNGGIESLEATKKLFVNLGMNEEQFKSLEPDHLPLIMEAFNDSKKK